MDSFLALGRKYHSQRGTSLQNEVELVEYPPKEIVSPDEVFPLNSVWVPRRWYRGWTKSLLPAVRFDAKSTELALAQLFESSTPEVSWWLRVESQQDVWIPWGNRKRHYPDFIVVTDDGHHWLVEGKADDRANDPDVLAKKDAGFEWARFANDSGDAPDTWHYLFATETAIRQAGGPGPASRTSPSGSDTRRRQLPTSGRMSPWLCPKCRSASKRRSSARLANGLGGVSCRPT